MATHYDRTKRRTSAATARVLADLCGPAGNMPAQMKLAVSEAIAKVGKMPLEQADAMVTDWQIKGKYNVEVW